MRVECWLFCALRRFVARKVRQVADAPGFLEGTRYFMQAAWDVGVQSFGEGEAQRQ